MSFDPAEHGHPYAFHHGTPRWEAGTPMRGRGWSGASLVLQLALIPVLFAIAIALFADREVASSAGAEPPEPATQARGAP